MKRYILLRKNRESGPYYFDELKALGIASTDLIWVEGESTSWSHPSEISELQPLVKVGILIPLHVPPQPSYQQQNEEYSESSMSTLPDTLQVSSGFSNNIDYSSYFTEKDEFHWERQKRRTSLWDVGTSFFGLGVLLIGVVMFAFVVKKLVDHFGDEPYVASAQAIEISKETLPASISTNAAKTFSQSTPALTLIQASDSLVKEPALPKPTEQKSKKAEKLIIKPIINEPAELTTGIDSAQPEEDLSKKQDEEKKETTVEKKAPSLTLSANDYKVGMFGGISELELSVNNPSSVAVEKAIVEVDFLKPNGNVVKTQTVTVENLSAGGSKKIAVPSSSRGVKISYRVVSINKQE